MIQQDYVAVFITFGMGLVAGVYLYLSGFVPLTTNFDWPTVVPNVAVENTFTMVGEMYGGCQMANQCSAFQITEDRAYRFRAQPDAELRTGILTESLMDALINALERAPLERYVEPIESDSCAAYVDGIDYRYTVTAGGQEYVLDTCTTRFEGDSLLGETLTEIWQYLGNR